MASEQDYLVAQMVKNLPAMQDTWVRPLGQKYPLKKEVIIHSQYSCLQNSKDRKVWWATVHGITKSQTTESLTLLLFFQKKQGIKFGSV